ncbi:ABC transporter ATP-binding protein [Actinopolymorpha pittospori]|uniref:Peptide/nickel transport system ATP-binding protein n=1 Tax=Actinopolymorpha pittospori TaxID=648752 RepID=A0A927N6J6_9ACTN|nr:ABC transporter ATP-binding protein [Actinopolymorpha pittospori]MBE1612592.1 peptide/nickel transport system ATP-binding protein [Actinopolymorpha pittospori]
MTETMTADMPQSSRSDALLAVRDLRVSFPSEAGRVDAVGGVSFDLQPGRTLGVVGESGSGKSVTSLAIMGLLDDAASVHGSIKLGGRELLGLDDHAMSKIRGKDISMVFQDPLSTLTPVFTIGDQLVEALTTHSTMGRRQAAERAVELLRLVGIPQPESRLKSFPHEFSGGMRQRVVIAIAIANNPKVIIADEPTTALDVTIQAQILQVLKRAQEETGAAVIMITHDMGVVASVADDVVVMYAGRPVEHASVDDVFATPRMPYTIGLLAAIPRADRRDPQSLVPIQGNPPILINLPDQCQFADRCPIAIDACRGKVPELVAVLNSPNDDNGERRDQESGHQVACIRAGEIEGCGTIDGRPIFPVPEIASSDLARVPRGERKPVLAVDNLVKEFPLMKGAVLKRRVGTVYAVNGVSFDIREGETMAIVGESGCGKTTALLEIMELAPQRGSDIRIDGRSMTGLSKREITAVRRDLQIVFQDPMGSLNPRSTVFDLIAEPMRAFRYSSDEVETRIEELMDLVGLNSEHSDRFPAAFSGGQRQRIGIARALATNPKLIVLDEPVSALDVSIQAGVINLLEELKAKLGISFLFVAHDLSVVRHIADRIGVMYLGKFVEYGEVDAVFEDPQHPYTAALLSAIPLPDPVKERTRERILLTGDLPSPIDNSPGCRFASRCQLYQSLEPDRQARCRNETPTLSGVEDLHVNACHWR